MEGLLPLVLSVASCLLSLLMPFSDTAPSVTMESRPLACTQQGALRLQTALSLCTLCQGESHQDQRTCNLECLESDGFWAEACCTMRQAPRGETVQDKLTWPSVNRLTTRPQ